MSLRWLAPVGALLAISQTIFAAWDQPSGGLVNLQPPAQLRYGPTIPCALANADPAYDGEALKDFFGDVRAKQYSIGHHEANCQ